MGVLKGSIKALVRVNDIENGALVRVNGVLKRINRCIGQGQWWY